MISCATIWITVLCYNLLTLIVHHIQFCGSGSTRFTRSGLTPGLTISGAIILVTSHMHDDEVLSDGFGPGVLDTADLETIPDDNVTCHSQRADVFEDDCEPVMSTWSIVGRNQLSNTSTGSMAGASSDPAINNAVFSGMRNTLPKFPWEMNLMAKVFGRSSNLLEAYQLPDPTVFAGYQVPKGYEPLKPIEHSVKIVPFAVRRLRIAAQPLSDDMIRNLAISKWRLVIESDIQNSEVGRQIQAYCETFQAEQNILSVLEDVFNKKATATLYKRVNSFLPFVKWSSRYTEHPLKLQEQIIYAYVCNLRAVNKSPTAGEAFKQSLNFAIHMLGLSHDGLRTISQRVSGVCNEMYTKKRKLKQATVLKVPHVAVLEFMTQFAEDVKLRCVAGHLVFCIYSSCRWSDSQKIESLKLVSTSNVVPLIEAEVSATKSATSQELKTRLLPLIAISCGVNSACEWGKAWMDARRLESLVADGSCLTPAISSQGNWLDRKMSTAEASAYLKDLLITGRVPSDEANQYTSHSLKATALSWLAKHGTDLETRRLMGHHLHPTLKSVVTYSRDMLIHGHSVLSNIVDEIVAGVFEPDCARDVLLSRLKQRKLTRALEVNPKLNVEDPNAQSCSSNSVPCVEINDIDEISLPPTEASVDDIDDEELQSALKSATELWDSMSPATHPTFVIPNHINTMQHIVHGTVHFLKESNIFLCGRVVTDNYSFTIAEDIVRWPVCEHCKNTRAFNLTVRDEDPFHLNEA